MINYKHLRYFWEVAKEGSIARASERLHITPQTISGQLALLEESLGQTLFLRTGRNLKLSETGRLAFSYADDIFALGSELEDAVRNVADKRPVVLKVGVTDVVPKSITYRLLSPVLEQPDPVRIISRENNFDNLLADLAIHKIDLVIADSPIPHDVNVRGFNHLLGECGISFFAVPGLASKHTENFPQSLNGAPFLMPGDTTVAHSRINDWFDRLHIQPHVVGEFDDSALMKAFGQAGTGIFISPSPMADEVMKKYGVVEIGQTDEVREQFYAISVERKISHPAVSVITKTAKKWLFRDRPHTLTKNKTKKRQS